MKTIAVTIPEQLDGRAAAEARRQGVSKSELIRRGLLAVLPESTDTTNDDAWTSLAGFGSDKLSVAPGEVDEIVYGSAMPLYRPPEAAPDPVIVDATWVPCPSRSRTLFGPPDVNPLACVTAPARSG